MKYSTDIIVPLVLSRNVVSVEFDDRILVSLDCHLCGRSLRTVVMDQDREKTYCTPTRHAFPGRILAMGVADRKSAGLLSSRSTVVATYRIEYEFEPFVDSKYRQRTPRPGPTWSRVTFSLTCKCGRKTAEETQNNLVRPFTDVCDCGKDLYFEDKKIPLFQNTVQA